LKTILLILCLLVPLTLSGCGNHPVTKVNGLNTSSWPNFGDNKEGILLDTYSPEANPNNDISPKIQLPKLDVDGSQFSKKEKSWFYQPKKDGTPSGEPKEILDLISKNSACYLGDTSLKNIYLTFDEGYENGFTGRILDILKENNVKAAFFVTNPYINTSGDLIKRMVSEGHLVCNHSTHHPSMASITNSEDFAKELLVVQNNFESLTGTKMPRFFRPPMGKYSELSLKYTEALGYKTIFWSFAYVDWKRDNQPSTDHGKKMIMSRTHPGGIYLLHASSRTNADILDSVLKDWKSQGYEFKSLNELPSPIKN
jgi:peptidoglycan-N-acetylmuramic acid deacetylase